MWLQETTTSERRTLTATFTGYAVDGFDYMIYTFLIPILGGDSPEKSRAIWCSNDRAGTWLGWMLRGVTPPAATAKCDDAAIERNLALSRKIHVNGTPAIVLEDGNRIPGAVGAVELEKRLQALVPANKS